MINNVRIAQIMALTQNDILGVNNDLVLKLPEDLQYFKNLTRNAVVCMGRLTYESIGRPLPNRVNIVLTSQVIDNPDIITCSSVAEMLHVGTCITNEIGLDKMFIIGGAGLFEATGHIVDKLYLNRFSTTLELDPNSSYISYTPDLAGLTLMASDVLSPSVTAHIYERLPTW
jgi:dihydrofolate reductase